MPSRKKKAGKARKAAKEAKAAEEDVQEEGEEKDALESQMQRLAIENLLRHGHKCLHLRKFEFEFEFEGESKSSMLSLCRDFKNEFTNAYNESVKAGEKDMINLLNAGTAATVEKFASVWNHAELVGYVSSCYVAQAVQYMLDGNDRIAGGIACVAYFLEESIATCIEKTQPAVKWLQVLEVSHVDLHTLVEFLRKRIPCKCLDEKYEEVRSIPRMGICTNLECTLPGRKAERSEMFYCGRCRFVCYCSTECQKMDWRASHKKECKELAREKAEFAAKQRLLQQK